MAHLRFYPNGDIAGFDIPTTLSVAQALGYNSRALMLLLDAAEAGLKEAIHAHGNRDTAEHLDPNFGS
jgi:hypothetical protein